MILKEETLICITDPGLTLTEKTFAQYFALLQAIFLGIETWEEEVAEGLLRDLFNVAIEPNEVYYVRYVRGEEQIALDLILARVSMERLLTSLFYDNSYFYTVAKGMAEQHEQIIALNAERRSQDRVNKAEVLAKVILLLT